MASLASLEIALEIYACVCSLAPSGRLGLHGQKCRILAGTSMVRVPGVAGTSAAVETRVHMMYYVVPSGGKQFNNGCLY